VAEVFRKENNVIHLDMPGAASRKAMLPMQDAPAFRKDGLSFLQGLTRYPKGFVGFTPKWRHNRL
jgi:hypothetical protein